MQSYRRPWIIVWNVATLHHQSFPCHLCTSGSEKLIFIVNTIIASGSGIVLFIAVTLLWLPQMLFQMLIPSEMLPVIANLTYVPFNKKFMIRTDQTMWISQGIVSETGLSEPYLGRRLKESLEPHRNINWKVVYVLSMARVGSLLTNTQLVCVLLVASHLWFPETAQLQAGSP